MSDTEDSVLNTTRLRLQSLSYKVQEHRLEKAWTRFENAGFKPILIKGWAAAQVYPNPSERRFNDIDLMIDPLQYDEAVEFLEQFDSNSGIDLHKNAKTLDTLSFEELYARTKIVDCGAAAIRVLCPEDHLRVLCVHWLIDSGAKKEKLWDIYYAIENRPANFDWERCLNAAGEIRREWIACVVGLAHLHLGLRIDDTPLAKESKEVPGWLIKAIEKEWRSAVHLKPLYNFLAGWNFLRHRKELQQQIIKRIPPNPILATIDMEGKFKSRRRFLYQTVDVFKRLNPLLKKLLKTSDKSLSKDPFNSGL